MITLDEFIAQALTKWPSNAWVKEPGFAALYVRVTKRFVAGEWRRTIDLANLEAQHPGQGTFTRLVERLRKQYPEMTIYVESVVNPRLGPRLLRMGFLEREHEAGSFYLLPEKR